MNTTDDQAWLKEYPDSGVGLDKFCQEHDAEFLSMETEFFKSDYFRQVHGVASDVLAAGGAEGGGSVSRRNDDDQHQHHYSHTSFGGIAGKGSSSFWDDIASKVPCRGDFFRYVQWHNLLHQALDYVPHKMPVLTLYYEDYQAATFNHTAFSVLEFLGVEPARNRHGRISWAEFHSRLDYDGFFSTEQQNAVELFAKTLSSHQVWGEIEHYFS